MSLFRKKPVKQKQPSVEEIRAALRKKYAEVSQSAEGKFSYPTGRSGARALGYDLSVLEGMPDELVESFCGVGNPFVLGPIRPEETVLDVGCGAGFDLFVASRLVGRKGKVCGIDLTAEMAAKARKNLARAGIATGEVRLAGAEDIPYDEKTFDIVISNGVLNLSPLKEKSFQEIRRVLKSGGRLQFADIVLKADLPQDVANSLDAWSD
jgi:SAM-dependent methyltransferase